MRLLYLFCLVSVLTCSQSSMLYAQERPNPDEGMRRHFEQLEQMIHKLEEHGQQDEANRVREQLERARKAFAETQERRERERAERSERGEHSPGDEQERREIDQRIHHLRVAAESLHAIGQHDQAEELLRKAEQLEHELRGDVPPEHHIHREALEQLEAMRRELHGVREELEGLRAEVRMLRETLLRLPPPAAPHLERRLNPPVVPSPDRRSSPAPSSDEHPLEQPPIPRTPSTIGLFNGLDGNKDNTITAEELGPLKQAWATVGIEVSPDEKLTAEAFQKKMQAFLDARTQVRISISTTHTGTDKDSPGPKSAELKRRTAEALFNTIDRDGNNQISAEEWNRSRTLKPRFESAHIELSEPMSRDDFIKHYLHLEEHADHSDSDHAEPGR